MILVHIDGVPGDCTIDGYRKTSKDEQGVGQNSGWFVANTFSFGVQREMKESGEKSGTEDISVGVAELEECEIGKSVDRASPLLAQFAIIGNSLGTAFIDFVEIGGHTPGGEIFEGKPLCYLRFKLDRCFVKSWRVSGDADDRPTEEVAFYYNKIAFEYLFTPDGKTFKSAGFMEWNNVRNEVWLDHKLNLMAKVQ